MISAQQLDALDPQTRQAMLSLLAEVRAKEELIARRAIKALEGEEPENLDRYIDQDSPSYQRMLDKIAELLNVTTLRYQRMEDMIAAIGLPREQLCTYCWTGQALSYEYNPRQQELNLL